MGSQTDHDQGVAGNSLISGAAKGLPEAGLFVIAPFESGTSPAGPNRDTGQNMVARIFQDVITNHAL
jgi:hypothetical protein